MSTSDLLAAVFLAYLFVLLPRAASRSARVLRGEPARDGTPTRPVPSRERILVSTLAQLVILFTLTWVTALYRDWDLFWCESLGLRDALAGVAVLLAMLSLRALLVASRDAGGSRPPRARAWMPRTSREWVLFTATCVAAGVAEEAAYRGMAFFLLEAWIGLVPAVLLCSTAFALAHVAQERRSVAVIFVFALLLHALVELTGRTLFVAMIVHTVYDLIAGVLLARRVQREDAAATGAGA